MQQLKTTARLPMGAGIPDEAEQAEEIRKRPAAIDEIARELNAMGITDINKLSVRQKEKLHKRIKARMRAKNPEWQKRQDALAGLSNWQRNQLLKDTRGTPLMQLPLATIEAYALMLNPKTEQRLLDAAIPDDQGALNV